MQQFSNIRQTVKTMNAAKKIARMVGNKSIIIMPEMLLAVNAPKAMIAPDSFDALSKHYKTG